MKRIRQRTIALILISLTLVSFSVRPVLANKKHIKEYKELHKEATKKLKELKQEEKDLEYLVLLLEDEEYVSKLARQQHNVSLPYEIIINLPFDEE